MRSPIARLLLPLGLLLFGVALSGANAGDCLPEPVDFVCESDSDCPYGQVCNLFDRCVDAFVTLEVDHDWYDAGATVGFTVNPHGLPVEVGSMTGVPPWSIERWSNEQDRWVRLRVGTLFGCRVTGCAEGIPVELCVDPGPAWCREHDEPFTDSWDGMRWVTIEEVCGAQTIAIDRRVPASAGNYRVVYHYGDDPHPGATSPTGSCSAQTESVNAVFGIR